jgi:hypothetical protein
VEAEHRRFSALIAQKRKAELLRDSLVSELTVIRTIDGQGGGARGGGGGGGGGGGAAVPHRPPPRTPLRPPSRVSGSRSMAGRPTSRPIPGSCGNWPTPRGSATWSRGRPTRRWSRTGR